MALYEYLLDAAVIPQNSVPKLKPAADIEVDMPDDDNPEWSKAFFKATDKYYGQGFADGIKFVIEALIRGR